MQVAVHLIEEVLRSTVEDDVESARLEKMSKVDHRIILPVLRMLLNGSETF